MPSVAPVTAVARPDSTTLSYSVHVTTAAAVAVLRRQRTYHLLFRPGSDEAVQCRCTGVHGYKGDLVTGLYRSTRPVLPGLVPGHRPACVTDDLNMI